MDEFGGDTSGDSQSYWLPRTRKQSFQSLNVNISVDVLVVGAGIAGLSAAYTLVKAGKKVAVLDDGLIASGETGRTSAHLATFIDSGFAQLCERFGIASARLIAESHQKAIDTLETILKDENIHADYKRVNGYLFSGPRSLQTLKAEARALEQMKNVPFDWVERAPIASFDTGRSLVFAHQAQFHPVKYVNGLAEAIRRQGGQIYENTHVASCKDGTPCQATTATGFVISAADIIVATNSPINDRITIHTKQAQYRSYVVGVAVPQGAIGEGLYWDTREPYHYLRVVPSPEPDNDYVLIGGEDHRTGEGQPKKAMARLRQWVRDRFPQARFAFEWSGQIVEPIDGLAFIGRNPFDKHIYVHTGMSGNGLTYGLIAGQLIPALILGEPSPYADIYAPSRFTVKACNVLARETMETMRNYGDWFKIHEHSEKDLKPREGHVERRGLAIDAVYKDSDGELHRMSAVCPHLGGIVRWNPLEQSWDCPCHGSRFTALGDVVAGPANCGLKKR